jgi:hypothetical protein
MLDENYFAVFAGDGVLNLFSIVTLENLKIFKNQNKFITYIIVSNYSFKHLQIIK